MRKRVCLGGRRSRGDRRWLGAGLALGLAAALSGCSSPPPLVRAAYDALGESSDPTGGMAPMAELPGAAGAVVAVMQSEAHDYLTQRIVLKGDPDTVGENAIVVKVNEGRQPWDLDGPSGLPTRSGIAAELDQDFAGVDMRLSDTFEHNSFGPFGYAIGHPTPRVTCVYAWQFGVFKWSKLGEAPAGAPSMPVHPTSVRVRLCRSTLDEAEIISMLRQLQVFPPGSRMAYVDPASAGSERAGDALGAAGVGYFVGQKSAPALDRIELTPRHRRRRLAARHHARTAELDDRAAALDPPAHGAVKAPMPDALPANASNPLLAPLAAQPRAASADDMPLPSRADPARAPPPPPKAAFVPLPN